METRLGEIDRKEQDLEKMQLNLKDKLKEIVAKDKQLNLKEEELERKNKQYEERLREFELYAVEIEEDGDKVADQLRELELRAVQFRELEEFRRKCEADGKKLEERMHELDCKEKQFEGRVQGFDLRSKNLERQIKEVELDKRKFEADLKILDKRILEVDCKERGLNKGLVDLKSEQKKLESNQRKLEANWKKLEERFSELEEFRRKCEADEKKLEERMHELDCKEKQFEVKVQGFELDKRKFEADLKKLEERFCEVSSRERQLDSRLELLESDKIKFEADRKMLDEQLLEVLLKSIKTEEAMEELESDKIKFEADRKKLDEQLLEVELKSKKTEEAMEELELKRKDFEEKSRKLESDRREFKVDREKLDDLIASLEKQKAYLKEEEAVSGDNGVNQCSVNVPSIEITSKACQMVEKSPIVRVAVPKNPQLQQTVADLPEIADSQHQPVPAISTQDPLPKKRKLSDGQSISIKNADSSCKPEKGKDLLVALLRQYPDFTKVRDKVVKILQSSLNPAITVLNTMKFCLPTKSIKEEVPISWCISLLKELKGVSYTIGHSTIEEARVFSLSWKENIKQKKGDHMEIACFLLFVDAYQLGLTRATIPLIEFVHCSKQLHDFFEQIGMPDFLPGIYDDLFPQLKRGLPNRENPKSNKRKKHSSEATHGPSSKVLKASEAPTTKKGVVNSDVLKSPPLLLDDLEDDIKDGYWRPLRNCHFPSNCTLKDPEVAIRVLNGMVPPMDRVPLPSDLPSTQAMVQDALSSFALAVASMVNLSSAVVELAEENDRLRQEASSAKDEAKKAFEERDASELLLKKKTSEFESKLSSVQRRFKDDKELLQKRLEIAHKAALESFKASPESDA